MKSEVICTWKGKPIKAPVARVYMLLWGMICPRTKEKAVVGERGGTRGKMTIVYEDAISLLGYDPIRFEVIEAENSQANFFYLSKTIKSTISYQNYWTIP